MTFETRGTPSRFLSLPSFALLIIITLLTGCDSNNNFEPIEIPPPRQVADSLFIATGTGLKFHDFTVGSGAEADTTLAVEFHFIMWLRQDSSVVSSSYFRGLPQVTVLGNENLIQGMEEGLTGMRTGGDRQLIIPPSLGYGAEGYGEIVPPDATLIVEIALLRVGVVTG